MSGLEVMMFNIHTKKLKKALKRITELESAMQEFVDKQEFIDKPSSNILALQMKYFKYKFKKLLEDD